jgi:ElaB/YqjD/DUF883 family membrane-anchored ribosome-binding protein
MAADDSNTPTQNALDQRLRTVAHSAIDRAIDAAAPAAQWLDEKTRRQQELANTAGEYVSGNPAKAVLVAFVVGLIIGKIVL